MMQTPIGLALAVLIASPTPGQPPHSDEIQAYASLAGMAQVASDRCTDLLVNNEMLRGAPAFFHLTPEDEQSVRFAYDIEAKRLAAAIDGAPSLQAWCDAAYRAYGPEGDVVKGFLARR